MVKYLQVAREIAQHFESFYIIRIAWDANSLADVLSHLASSTSPSGARSILLEELEHPIMNSELIGTIQELLNDWRTPYILWLRHGLDPSVPWEVRHLKDQA